MVTCKRTPTTHLLTYTQTYLFIHTHTHTDEDHFNSNVQLRRTARHDVGVAKQLQEQEVHSYRQEEFKRRDELKRR